MSYQREKKKVPADTQKDEFNFKEWRSVELGAMHIFSGKKLSNSEFVKMFETIRAISTIEVGTSFMVFNNYEDIILKRGMQLLREEIKEKPGHEYLIKLGELWTNFYTTILPTLQSLFYSIPMQPGITLKQMTMASFRDLVLFQLKVDEALSADNYGTTPKAIKQMFCVLLQATRDKSENYLKLDTLAARVISPMLGTKGLYIRSEVKEPHDSSRSERFSSTAQPDSVDESAKFTSSSCDDEFEELMFLRHQDRNHYQGYNATRLSCVEEKEGGISESLASLIADGFEIG